MPFGGEYVMIRKEFPGYKFFLYFPNTADTFEVHGITSQYCLTLSVIGLNGYISCSIRSDELANCQNSSDV